MQIRKRARIFVELYLCCVSKTFSAHDGYCFLAYLLMCEYRFGEKSWAVETRQENEFGSSNVIYQFTYLYRPRFPRSEAGSRHWTTRPSTDKMPVCREHGRASLVAAAALPDKMADKSSINRLLSSSVGNCAVIESSCLRGAYGAASLASCQTRSR